MLNQYLTATQNLLGTGAGGNLYPTATLTTYINQARAQVAAEGQCIRAIPPINGPISSILVLTSGAGYTGAPTITVSGPDSPSGAGVNAGGLQATATATISSGGILAVTLTNGGAGYFAPVVTFSSGGSHPTQATAIATVSGINQTVALQEVYPFSVVNPMVATSGSGIASILQVNSVSLLWGTFRYTLMHYGWSKYQAKVRTYTAGYYYLPSVFAQFAQGASGSLYMYPIANQAYPMEWDCCCLPQNLAADTDVEAIPYPWTDAVPYRAAYYAFLQAQRFTDADRMYKEYDRSMKRARAMSQPRGITNWYGRG